MTTASEHLLALGREVLAPYARLPGVACAAITGSGAEGLSDNHSDLDTTVYYDTMPPEADIRRIREQLWHVPTSTAAADLRALVAETADLVESELPAVDTGACRKSLARRDMPWNH